MDWVSGRASDSCDGYNGETGGFAIYCQPRHKGSLILSQDSVGGILEDGSPREVAGQYRCLPNQERETE